MSIAIQEMRRKPARFGVAISILTLLATLLMLLGGLLDGLLQGSTSALRAQRGDVVAFSGQAKKSVPRSRITQATRAIVEKVPGVARVGGIGVAQLGARVPGQGVRDLVDVAMFGYEIAPKGVPQTPKDGNAYADRSLEVKGVRKGMTIAIGPARSPVKIIGWVDDLAYSGQGTLWVSPATWRATVNANRPGGGVGADVFQVLLVQRTAGGPSAVDLAGAIDAASGQTDSLTLDAAIEAIPGVVQQRSTFNQIIGVTVIIATVVVGLFFALLTVERVGLYGVLKAIGATSARLFRGVMLQALIVTAVASVIGGCIAVLLEVLIPAGSIPYTLLPVRVLSSVAFLLIAAIVGCTFSLRRVLRIDPAAAIGSGV